jgi:hypothetical protein
VRGKRTLPIGALALTFAAILGCADGGMPNEASVVVLKPTGAAPQAPAAGGDLPTATAGRKIVYNANVELVTENLSKLEESLTTLLRSAKAYIADSERTGSTGNTRRGVWKVRVPVEGYDVFLKGVVALGEPIRVKADSQDVSEEFYDLDARQKAKKVEEDRLLKHLTDSTGKLEEILAVERELSRVRGEIERMQGRLQALTNLTTLATVTLTVSEIKNYVPAQAPTLGTRVERTFAASLVALQSFGEAVLIAAVAIVPWIPLLALGFGMVYWLSRSRALRPTPLMRIDDIPPPSPRR